MAASLCQIVGGNIAVLVAYSGSPHTKKLQADTQQRNRDIKHDYGLWELLCLKVSNFCQLAQKHPEKHAKFSLQQSQKPLPFERKY